jgi:DNA-binding response OmpR family regulator
MLHTRSPVAFCLVPERVAVQVGGREVVLTPTQYAILAVLMGEPGRAFSRAELVQRAFEAPVDERNVDVHVKELRRKLEPDEQAIVTVRGRGYRYRPA